MLTALALALLVTVGSNVNRLVPFYAIGVFTGFAMAGLGMARYHRLMPSRGGAVVGCSTRPPAWCRRWWC